MPNVSMPISQKGHFFLGKRMDVGVYKITDISNAEIIAKIRNHDSFTLECEEFDRYKKTLEWLEKTIEAEGMKVRIYMKARVATIASAAWTGWGTVAAAAAGLAMAAHNVATWSPDYEIAKHPLGCTLYVTFVK